MTNLIFYFFILQIILIVPSFFIYKKLISKWTSRYLILKAIIPTLLIPILLTISFGAISYQYLDPIWRSKKFNSTDWIKEEDSRYRMINDLISSNLLIGKTKNQVKLILGPNYSENCWLKNTYCYIAYDPDNFAFLDHFELIVHFDKNNLVKNVTYELI